MLISGASKQISSAILYYFSIFIIYCRNLAFDRLNIYFLLNLISELLNFIVLIALSKDICGTIGTSGTTVVDLILFPYILLE